MARRLLGSATTNSSGVAVLSNAYTGSGAGKIDVVATTTIDDSTVVSQPYTVIDALFKDIGTSTDYGNWSNWTSYEPKLTRDTYCKIEVDTENSKTNARMYKQFDASNNDIAIEFDVKQVTSSNTNVWATLRNNATNVLGNLDMNRFSSYGGVINEWVHFKLIISPTNCLVYINNNSSPYTYISGGITRFYFQIDTNTTELDYKNFVIYPV